MTTSDIKQGSANQDGFLASEKKDAEQKGKQAGRVSEAELYSHKDKADDADKKRKP